MNFRLFRPVGAMLRPCGHDRGTDAGRQRSRGRALSKDDYVVKTLVTTELIRRIADSYGVTTHGNIHVGFKWIAGLMDEKGPEKFLFGTEESHGYMVGQYVRDKDGAVACMLMAELAALAKSQGKSLHQKLESLYWQHGYHDERTLNLFMEGSQGMSRMKALMTRLRQSPPQSLGGLEVKQVRDYQALTITANGKASTLDAPRGDMVVLDLGLEGNYVAVRPSGTEPVLRVMVEGEDAAVVAELADAVEEKAEELLEKGKDLSTESRAAVLNAFNEGQERLGRQRDRLVKLLG